MELLWTLIIGVAAGWLAGVIMKGEGYGVGMDLVLGILGAVVGRLLFTALGLSAWGLIGSLVMSTIGAVVLIAIARVARRA